MGSDERGIVVVALGGNAFTRADERGTYAEQSANADAMARGTTDLMADGWRIAIVHGNGPQVGSLAIQQEEGRELVPAQPLFALDAMTEAQLGSLITLALRRTARHPIQTACVVSHTVVDADDPAFRRPTKPIGPFYDAATAERLAGERGWTMHEDAGRGYRRVVASPEPVDLLETHAIRTLVAAGTVVVAAGGGGIPVVADGAGYRGVDAVVDKDLAAQRLASALGAHTLALVTGVPHVMLDFGTARQQPISVMAATDAEKYLAEGQFAEGSMAPKIRAAVRFLADGGRRVVITSPDRLVAAARGEPGAGTSIVPTEGSGA